jgi:thiamine biosynthesis lipoprotein
MRETRLIMGMPVTVEIIGEAPDEQMEGVFAYFTAIDKRFSLYKPESEISALNQGRIADEDLSPDMNEVLSLAERTKAETNGFFEILRPDGVIDPSGIVKGWAIRNAARIIRNAGFESFCVDAGGDIQTGGGNSDGEPWRIGIRNPFNDQEIIKAVSPGAHGVATSGSYVRGPHIYNPIQPGKPIEDIISLTVIGPDVFEADRFATAAFAMGSDGIYFIEGLQGLEGYVVSAQGIATQTTGFGAFVIT